MAATWIKSLHGRKGSSLIKSISKSTDYIINKNKIDSGVPVRGYACDPRTVNEEFALSKNEYEYITGRAQGQRDVIAYHIRQSFKPGEVDAQTANEIGYK